MKILYYDCFAGISGDMNLSALIDAGANATIIEQELQKLNLDNWSLKVSKSSKNGIFGTRVDVICSCEEHEHHHEHCEQHHHHDDHHSHEHHHDHHEHSHHHHHEHRKFSDIAEMINCSALSENVKKNAIAIFKKIADAEAQVHGKSVDDVNFHEVGAVDSIIDIVGSAIAFELLGIDKAVSTPVELGGGTVKCAHGVLTVPAPATAIIAKDFPSKIGGAHHECTTPTGAGIIATMCSEFSPKINGKIIASGIGIGHRDSHELTNILRVSIIETDENSSELTSEKMFELSANIDDMTPEHIAELCQKLFDTNALDVWQENIVMKKNRLAVKVCALVREADSQNVAEAFFKNSTTLGLRKTEVTRLSINREIENFESKNGLVRIKKSSFANIERIKPEFDDCKKIADLSATAIDIVSDNIKNEFKNTKA